MEQQTITSFIEYVQTIEPHFHDSLEEYKMKGIWESEALLLIAAVQWFKCDMVLESGRGRGFSTVMLAKYFQGNPTMLLLSVDDENIADDAAHAREALKSFPQMRLLVGNAFFRIPYEIWKARSRKIALFIDGPKDIYAVKMAQFCLLFPAVQFVAIHDVYKGSSGRQAIEERFSDAFFSDHPDFVNKFSYLNNEASHFFATASAEWRLRSFPPDGVVPFAIQVEDLTSEASYGPVLGIISRRRNVPGFSGKLLVIFIYVVWLVYFVSIRVLDALFLGKMARQIKRLITNISEKK